MKKIILLLVVFTVSLAGAQEYNPYKFAVLNSTLISPNIDLDKGRSVVVTNADQFSGYFQIATNPVRSADPDSQDIRDGVAIIGTGINHGYDINSYMGYVGGIAGRFRGTINIGYIKSLADDGYSGTSTNANISWHFTDNTFVGLNVNNIHRVGSAKNDEEFFYYSKMTPKLFASLAITENWIVSGDWSSRVNDIQLRYQNESFSAGAYYSGQGKQGLFGTYSLGRFTFLGGVNTIGTDFDDVVFGLKFE